MLQWESVAMGKTVCISTETPVTCVACRSYTQWMLPRGHSTEKSCPECRITSNLVIPSEYWVEEKEEKQKLIQKYKEAMSNKACRYFDEGRGSCPFGGNCFYKHAYPDGGREEPQRQKVGTSSRYLAQRRSHFWELIEERENNPFDNDEEEVVTFELGEMLLMLLAAGGDDELTDSEDEWDLFHDELEDFYDSEL